MRAIVSGLLSVLVVASSAAGADSPPSHDFTNLQRLASALKDFNYPENAAKCITIWRQGGGKGVSITRPVDSMDLADGLRLWTDNCKEMDLENVAVIQADGKTIRFVDVKDRVTSKKSSSVTLKPGDLVVVLQPPEK